MAIELMIAGLFAEIVALALPDLWGRKTPLEPSPAERSLQARFLYSMAPLTGLLVLTLMVGDWLVAGRAAREMLEARMANAAAIAADNIPFFLDAGQNLAIQMASNTRLRDASPEELGPILDREIKNVPFFSQVYVLDADGSLIAGYPQDTYTASAASLEEQMGIQLAQTGMPAQFYPVPPEGGEQAAQVSFIAPIPGQTGESERVLVARSDLTTNPFTQPILSSLNNLAGADGQGALIDDKSRILYHTDPALVMTAYNGQTGNQPQFYDDTAPNGTRRLVYYQPVSGRPWAVALMVPAHRSQQLALTIAAPLLGMIVVVFFLTVLLLRYGLRVVTASLQNLSSEAGRIAQGKLDHALAVDGEDEVGHMRRAFEQMRASLKARLDELNSLLLVSQGVASSLEFTEAVQPVLESALATGASAARVVLTPAVVPDLDGDQSMPVAFGLGAANELYIDLDEQILSFTRQQERLVLPTLTRPRLISLQSGSPRPDSLMAVALRHENTYYGCLWVAYDHPHQFSEEEVRFLATLAGHAALAAANSRLFLNAEIGRQRLAAILASSPDAVLVTDQNDRLVLANPAAWQVLGLGGEADQGEPVEAVIAQPELVELLRSSTSEKQSVELTLPAGQVYLATATSVLAEGQRVGRVCVLRDVTHFKELDALKSEFVATVSHDLRSPLTLMRGYATMLEMVGQLNEQQTSYVRKIVGGVETMSRLVNNLLDLGRIDAGIGLQLEMVPVHDIIERVVSGLQLQATQKRIQLTYEIPQQTIPLIEADQALLQQALQNLVENAVKYTRPDGKVHIRVVVRQDRMLFEINDTGIGISPVDQPRLFEKFYRGAQQGSKEQRGTGLGLAIVKSIAERHGGQVWVESQLGKGSTFYLAVPIRQVEARALTYERR
jgi:PAS domain S-box-containing protein